MNKKGIKTLQTIENEGDAISRVALMKTIQYADIDETLKKTALV